MTVELKIKSIHLGEEAKIIKRHERAMKAKAKWLRNNAQAENAAKTAKILSNLHEHRVKDVRNENRATFLARAYLENRAYATVEQKRLVNKEQIFTNIILPRVVKMVNKYGEQTVTLADIVKWTLVSTTVEEKVMQAEAA